MSEILFLVEQTPEGGYTARALGDSMFYRGGHLAGVAPGGAGRSALPFRGDMPKVIRLHIGREEVLAA